MSGTSENQPEASDSVDLSHAADNIDDVLLQAQKIVAKWEGFVEEQKQKRAEAAAQLQEIMDVSGLSEKGVDLSDPAFAQIAEDIEFQRQISLHFGLKLDKALPIDTSKPDVSRWRQRTNALKV
ncbi:MAG: hypothetical protein RI942_369 [Pseudomonadota bacterium]|jgi:bifunctional N-acetylglucosamine-1-phosphate-uridyltransferase/glucosamine-1-phosphate-acetyltransferase GlmU-like protein